jgi:hypothetical protein
VDSHSRAESDRRIRGHVVMPPFATWSCLYPARCSQSTRWHSISLSCVRVINGWTKPNFFSAVYTTTWSYDPTSSPRRAKLHVKRRLTRTSDQLIIARPRVVGPYCSIRFERRDLGPYIAQAGSDCPRLPFTTSSFSQLNTSNPTSPLGSQGMATGSALSKTTSLNQDLSGSDSDSSTSYATTSGGCEDKIQAREFCEQFVGPMPIDTFFSEFVPKATTERPVNKITFPHSFVLRNEDAFVRFFAITGVSTLTRTC